jgi:hypothetical protein
MRSNFLGPAKICHRFLNPHKNPTDMDIEPKEGRKSMPIKDFAAPQKAQPAVIRPLGTAVVAGSASLVRELSPLLQPMGRVRWSGDISTTECVLRSLSGSFWSCIVEQPPSEPLDARLVLFDIVARRWPTAVRAIVVERVDLNLVSRCTESGLVHQILYRPLESAQIQTLARRANVPGGR